MPAPGLGESVADAPFITGSVVSASVVRDGTPAEWDFESGGRGERGREVPGAGHPPHDFYVVAHT